VAELPVGWRVEEEWDMGDYPWDGRYIWVAYRWKVWTIKKLFRKPVEVCGWKRAGYSSPDREKTVQWILDTVKAMETIE
jgi:hypothetical protein